MTRHLLDICEDPGRLAQFLAETRILGETIQDHCDRLAKSMGDDIFAEGLYYLTHQNFNAEQARNHWAEIIQHRERLTALTGRAVALPTTVLDYFTSVHPTMDTPVALEAGALDKCARLNVVDVLSGLFNRRYFLTELTREAKRSLRLERPMALLLAKIHGFTQFNESQGHAAGDMLVAALARHIRQQARLTDLPARYSDSIFALILPHTDKAGALEMAQRLQEGTEQLTSKVPGLAACPIRLSLGLSVFPVDAQTPEDIIEAADRAMHRAAQAPDCIGQDTSEARTQRRTPIRLEAECLYRDNARPPLSCHTRDISPQGVRCITSTPLVPDTTLDLVLHDEARGLSLATPARVVWTLPAGNGQHTNGLFFHNLSEVVAQTLRTYLDSLGR